MVLDKKTYSLRIDSLIMEKFKKVALFDGRSINKEIEILMKQAVNNYEIEHGKL